MIRTKTRDEWISEALLTHGDKYGYSLVEYKNAHSKVKIICKDHGVFEQTPANHVHGQNCPFCSRKGNRTIKDFEKESLKVHGDTYDYSRVRYTNNKTKVEIICKTHGAFWQIPNSHLRGRGCPNCGVKRGAEKIALTLEKFITKSEEIHQHRYDYSLVNYTNNRTKVKISCHNHGEFLQTPDSHLAGQGCPSCRKTGFNIDGTAFVYFIISEDRDSIKIGITGNVEKRLDQLKRVTPFSFSTLKIIKDSAINCKNIESQYHVRFQSSGKKGFNGCTEWLKYSKELMNEIVGVEAPT